MRKLFLLLFVCLLAAPTAAQDATPEAALWTCPPGYSGQRLNVFNWSTYIGENTIADFEKACGVTVTYDVYASDDELLARLRQGNPGYDIIVPGDASVPIMVREGLLEKLDYQKIPHYQNIPEIYRNTPFDPKGEYALPYLLGTMGIGYNMQAVKADVTRWEQLFDYKGRVAWVDDSRAMIPIGLLMVGADPNSADPADVRAARDFLIAHGKNVAVIAQDDGDALLAKGEVDMAIEYNGDIFQLNLECKCQDFAYVVPEEGTAFSSGFVAIPKGAPNKALAEVFIDYLLDPQVAADIANYTAYPTPNQKAIDEKLIRQDLLENKGIYPDAATLKRLFYILPPAEAEQPYSDAWDEVKVALRRN
jgi:spermidine/putrescine transport system substrate-binding protein